MKNFLTSTSTENLELMMKLQGEDYALRDDETETDTCPVATTDGFTFETFLRQNGEGRTVLYPSPEFSLGRNSENSMRYAEKMHDRAVGMMKEYIDIDEIQERLSKLGHRYARYIRHCTLSSTRENS